MIYWCLLLFQYCWNVTFRINSDCTTQYFLFSLSNQISGRFSSSALANYAKLSLFFSPNGANSWLKKRILTAFDSATIVVSVLVWDKENPLPFSQLRSSAIKLSLYLKLTVWRAVARKPWRGCLRSLMASLRHPLEQILFQHKAFKNNLKIILPSIQSSTTNCLVVIVWAKTIKHIRKVFLNVGGFQWLILILGECIPQLSSWWNTLSNCKMR